MKKIKWAEIICIGAEEFKEIAEELELGVEINVNEFFRSGAFKHYRSYIVDVSWDSLCLAVKQYLEEKEEYPEYFENLEEEEYLPIFGFYEN